MHYVIFLTVVSPLLLGGLWFASDQMGPPVVLFSSSDDTALHQMARTIPSMPANAEISAQSSGVDQRQEAAFDNGRSNGPS
jgi:hypothetical protein